MTPHPYPLPGSGEGELPRLAAVLAACLTLAACLPPAAREGEAPGRPGAPATWTNGNKQGVGTSTTLESRVWFELMAGRDARPYLETLVRFANEGRMLPEQVWDRPSGPRLHLRFGHGTGSATPLAWSAAQLLRLARGVEQGRVVGMPEVVRRHFQGSVRR